MKIIFLCGSFEDGKDGVGDYTRRLALQLVKSKNKVQIISINDKFINSIQESLSFSDEINLDILRLPASESWKNRLSVARRKIEYFSPDWISLQFVPYAFQKHGLPFKFVYQLKNLNQNAKWHIMFHELWIGIDKQASLKNKLIGKVQRYLTRRMILLLAPRVIHTQSSLYQYMLKSIGANAYHLPLFGNIPYPFMNPKTSKKIATETISFVVFGGIHFGAPVKDFIREIAEYTEQMGTVPLVIFIGRGGAELGRWINECKLFGIETNSLGEQDAKTISNILLTANMGIVTTPFLLIEKSGSAAAMIEHGLPVVCVARNWRPNNTFTMQKGNGIYEYKPGNLKKIFASYSASSNPTTVTTVAEKFINDLM